MSAYQRELLPRVFLGDWDLGLDLAERSRRAWEEEGRPPLGAFATPAAATAAIYGYRGDASAAKDWLEHANNLVSHQSEHRTGVLAFAADIELHRGNPDEAAAIASQPIMSSQWRSPFAATRAEAMVRQGHKEAGEAVEWAAAQLGEDPYARGILLRGRALHTGDDSPLRESLALFREIECPYQEARSGWLLGGEEREQARETFERLGATPPAD